MAYIFDPIRNTFIDDEDKSLGNKLALNDEEIDKVIKQIDDKFGPGTVVPASELPPKEDPYKDFMDRNPAADGGSARLKAAFPLLAPALLPYAAAFVGTTATGLAAQKAIQNYFNENPGAVDKFKDYVSKAVGISPEGLVFEPDAPKEAKPEIYSTPMPEKENWRESFGDKELEDLKVKPEEFPAETEKLPITSGETKPIDQGPIILYNKKQDQKTFNEIKGTFDKVMELYTEGGKRFGGKEISDELYTKKFANKVKKFIDKKYGGNTQALANQLGIERVRINTLLKKHGIKSDRAGNKTLQNIFLEQDEDKILAKDLTNNIKKDETYLINRIKERFTEKEYNKNKNKFLNYKDLAEIMGVELTDKYEQDVFQTKLRSANKKFNIQTKPGFGKEVLYNLEDTVNKLTKYNLGKPIQGEGRQSGKVRTSFEKQKDSAGFGARTYILEQIRDASKDILGEEAILRAGEQYGHSEAIANQTKYKKLFKNSNAADISTLVFQDPVLNKDVLQAYGSTKSGIEQKRQPHLNTLEKLVGKKATPERIEEANQALEELNALNEIARVQIKEFQKSNKFVRDQENRIPDYELILPKEGETFKSGFLQIDMSNIDPSVSVGRILEINPNAKTFNDLSKAEQNIYRENLRNQISDYLKYFYQEAGVDREDILSLEEEILDKNLKSKVAKAEGGPIELSPMPRFNFSNGGAAGADDDFAKELEYYFLNEDAELPKATSYRETMNPVEALNDMIDPRNYPYYADLLVRSGLRVGEFGVRILPALGKLGSDLLTKPAFRVTGTKKTGYVQDYEDIPGTGVGLAEGLKLEGTGIFQDFLKNITPTSLEKKVGLEKLIEAEEQKQKDRRSTIAPKVLGETISLGAEVTAPIFPGLKLLRAFAADRKLPVNNVTKDIMEKEIDEALDARGIGRRDFMKVAGAGGSVMLAKMLGVSLETAPKVAEKVASTGSGAPPYFFRLVDKIRALGRSGPGTKDRSESFVYGDYEMEIDYDTGAIDIKRTEQGMFGDEIAPVEEVNMFYRPGKADETTGGKVPPDEYEEFTARPDEDGKMKDVEDGVPDDVVDEGSISKEELEQLIIRNLANE